MVRMTERFDYHIIEVDKLYDDRPTETGLIRLNTAWYRVEQELDRYERKLLSGIVHAVPIGYSEKNFMPIDPGYPNPRIFVGHDAIQQQRNLGYDWGNEKYNAGLKDKIEFMSVADYGRLIDAKVGEKVYFHPSVTEPENFIEEKDGKMYYYAPVDQIICTVTEKGIRMQGGYVLVEPHMEEEMALISETGLIVKTEVEAKMLEGTIRHVRDGIDLKAGDEILFQESSDWVFNVEGTDYYALREDEIWLRKTKK